MLPWVKLALWARSSSKRPSERRNWRSNWPPRRIGSFSNDCLPGEVSWVIASDYSKVFVWNQLGCAAVNVPFATLRVNYTC